MSPTRCHYSILQYYIIIIKEKSNDNKKIYLEMKKIKLNCGIILFKSKIKEIKKNTNKLLNYKIKIIEKNIFIIKENKYKLLIKKKEFEKIDKKTKKNMKIKKIYIKNNIIKCTIEIKF